MNSNQIKGALKDVAGNVRRKVGEAVGNPEQQLKGTAEQIAGKTQKAVGDIQQSIKKATRTTP